MSQKKLISTDLKRINRNKIYEHLYNSGPQSKQDIAYALHMSIPTVAQNIREMQERGLVLDAGMMDSTGGRKAQAIVFNARARYAVGLDVTRNHVGCVVVDLQGNIHANKKIKCAFANKAAYFEQVSGLVEEMLDSADIDRGKLLGVAIAVPAIVSEDGRHMTYSPVLGIDKGELQYFSDYIKYDCTLINDANAAAFSEICNNASLVDVVYLSLNNSVGGSIIQGGKVCLGNNQRAGEFGHMTVLPGGRTCYCGQKGCLDAYCNAKLLSDKTDGSLEKFFLLLDKGDGDSVQLWEKYLKYLSEGINNIRMACDYDIIIGGYVGAYMKDHLPRLREMVSELNTFEKDGSYLKLGRYHSEATMVGAALHYVDIFRKSV